MLITQKERKEGRISVGPVRSMSEFLPALVGKPEDLSSTPRTHMVKEENQLPQVVPSPPSA